jgi:hypothetical protein
MPVEAKYAAARKEASVVTGASRSVLKAVLFELAN